MTTQATIPTRLHTYFYRMDVPAEAEAYRALVARLTDLGVRCFNVNAEARELSGPLYRAKGPIDVELETETAHLFHNQWNTAAIADISDKGLRVFDWYEGVTYNNGRRQERTKWGHWLEQTDAMRAARANRVQCGYCGKQYEREAAPGALCNDCLDSEYLTPEDLRLLRIRGVVEGGRYEAPDLSAEERAELMPRYLDAQRNGTTEHGRARIAKARADVAAAHRKALENAETERVGATWILDHAPGLYGNAIYYNHTGRWCFGWRKALSGELLSMLLDVVSEFPCAYDIKKADGATIA